MPASRLAGSVPLRLRPQRTLSFTRSVSNGSTKTSQRFPLGLKRGKGFSTSTPSSPVVEEGTVIYDQVSKQPLMLTVFSIITTTSFVVMEVTRKEVPEDSPMMIKIFGSWIWNYVGSGLGLLGIFLSTKYPRFLVSEVRVAGKKVILRTHTLMGQKGPEEVFQLSDLMRVKATSNEYVNWKSVSTPRRFVLNKTEEIENLIPFGFSTSSPTMSTPSGGLSNVGGKTVTEAKMYEKALKERWTKKARQERK